VVGGVAAGNLQIPAGTSAKTYDLRAVYNGTADYAASPPADSILTVLPAATTTIAFGDSEVYSPTDQTISLTANLSGGGSNVGEGSVTFTVQSGAKIVATGVAAVASGQAAASFTLPGGTTVGTYKIHASYSGGTPGDYGASSADATLTVSKATPL